MNFTAFASEHNIQITDLQRHGVLRAPELHLLYIWIFTSVGWWRCWQWQMGKYHSLSLVSSVKRNIGYNNILLYHCCVCALCAVCAHLPHFIAVCASNFFPSTVHIRPFYPLASENACNLYDGRRAYGVDWYDECGTKSKHERTIPDFMMYVCRSCVLVCVCIFTAGSLEWHAQNEWLKYEVVWIQLNMICTMQTKHVHCITISVSIVKVSFSSNR